MKRKCILKCNHHMAKNNFVAANAAGGGVGGVGRPN